MSNDKTRISDEHVQQPRSSNTPQSETVIHESASELKSSEIGLDAPGSIESINHSEGSVIQNIRDQRNINTDGGDYAEENIDKRKGIFGGTFNDKAFGVVEGDVVIVAENEAYNVIGLPNKYLGLRAFGYEEKEIYAGRESLINHTVSKLTTPGEHRSLFFVTGASGSGKSSFVQAGLLPELEQHYKVYNYNVHYAIFRPSRQPLAALAAILRKLRLPAEGVFAPASPFMIGQQPIVQPNSVFLLVIDQFEECFTEAEAKQRNDFFHILTSLPPFNELPLHTIVTMRADYLPELFKHQALYDIAKQGIDLRAMSVNELKDAIQKPLQYYCPKGDKRFEETLLIRLAEEAAKDVTYLPLLQVTLEDLWRRGKLVSAYYSSLTDAIRERAEEVFKFVDHDSTKQEKRSEQDQNAILSIFLMLVKVSLDDDSRRDVRRRCTMKELAGDDVIRIRLIDELCNARLLSKGIESNASDGSEIIVVDIIHESLIANWDRLRAAIADQRIVLQQRERFEIALKEWLDHRSKENSYLYLLRGKALLDAIELDELHNTALRSPEAQEFLKRSKDSPQQMELLLASQRRRVESQRLAFAARDLPPDLAETALLLACEAVFWHNNPLSEQVLRDAIEAIPWRIKLLKRRSQHQLENISASIAQFSPDGTYIVSWREGQGFLWKRNGKLIAELEPHKGKIKHVVFSQEGHRFLTIADDATAKLWDHNGQQLASVYCLPPNTELTYDISNVNGDLSSDGRHILLCNKSTVYVWDDKGCKLALPLNESTSATTDKASIADHKKQSTQHDTPSTIIPSGHIFYAAFSSDGQHILTAENQHWTTTLWSLTGKIVCRLNENEGGILSPDGKYILTRHYGGTARLWTTDGKRITEFEADHGNAWVQLAFSPDGSRILIGGWKRVDLWTSDGHLLTSIPGDINRLEFRPDGNAFWVSTYPGIHLYDTDGHKIAQVSGGGVPAFSTDGRIAHYVGRGIQISAPDGQPIEFLTCDIEGFSSIALSPDGHHVLTTAKEYAEARLWELIGSPLPMMTGHKASVTGAFYTEGLHYILAESKDTIWLWSPEGEMMRTLQGHSHGFAAKMFDSNRELLLTLDGSHAYLWILPSVGDELLAKLLAPHQTLQQAPPEVYQKICVPASEAWLSPSGQRILVQTSQGTILYDDQGHELATLIGEPVDIPFSQDGRILTISSLSEEGRRSKQRLSGTSIEQDFIFRGDLQKLREARIWDANGVQQTLFVFVLHGGRNELGGMIFSPDGQRILFWEEHSLQIYDIQSGSQKNVSSLDDNSFRASYKIDNVVYSPDGNLFLTTSTDEHNPGVKLWDYEGKFVRALIGTEQLSDSNRVGFSNNGTYIFVTIQSNVLIFNRQGHRAVALRGHEQAVTSVVFSKNGERILTASADGTARLWDTNGQQLTIFRGHTAKVNSAVFSPDEQRVLTASDDKTTRQYFVESLDLLFIATQRVGRELNDEEIQRFSVHTPLKFRSERRYTDRKMKCP